jgi:hypothetical protein
VQELKETASDHEELPSIKVPQLTQAKVTKHKYSFKYKREQTAELKISLPSTG